MTESALERSHCSSVCMRIERWPALDRSLWLAAVAPVDPFAETGGTRARHRRLSNRNVVRGYGRWLTYLERVFPQQLNLHPADRITRDAAVRFVQELARSGNVSGTIVGRLEELREAAKVMAPERDWSFLGRISTRIQTLKSERQVPPVLFTTDQLLDLAFRLMGDAASLPLARRAAVLFRDGLLIGLLALRPLRRRNLTELTFEKDLLWTGSQWMISIPPQASKTHVRLEFGWPEMLIGYLERYRATYRPILAARCGRWQRDIGERLWVSVDGSPMTEDAIFGRVKRHTLAHLGVALSPHKFRHIAASTLAITDPAHVLSAAPLLGHRSFGTTESYYIKATDLEAHRLFARHLADRRRRKP